MPRPGRKNRQIVDGAAGQPVATPGSTVMDAPQFNNIDANRALLERTDKRRHSKKPGRQETRAPKYDAHIIGYIHFMACPRGFHRGVKYEHQPIDGRLPVTRNTVTKYIDVCASGFKYKKSQRRSNLQMTNKDIKEWIDGDNSTTWWEEYYRRCMCNGSGGPPSASTSSSTSEEEKESYVYEDDRDRCTTEPITVKGMLVHTLSALQSLKDAQTMRGMTYTRREDNLPIRDKKVPFPMMRAIFERVEARVQEYNTKNGHDKWSIDILDGYGKPEHRKLLEYHLRKHTLFGATMFLMQELAFMCSLRGDQALDLELSDLVAFEKLPLTKTEDDQPVLGAIMVNEVNNNNKSDIVVWVAAKDPFECMFNAIGTYFYYRYTKFRGEPPDVEGLQREEPSSSSTLSSSLSASASATSEPDCCSAQRPLRHRLLAQPPMNTGRRRTAQGSPFSPNISIKTATAAAAIKNAHKECNVVVGKVLHAGRRASSLWLELAGVSRAAIKKQLLHNETDTTAVHYANAPPLSATFKLSGWTLHDGASNFDPPRQDLHNTLTAKNGQFYELNDMVLPFYSQLMTLAEAQQATQSSDNCWRTLRGFACLVKHSIAGMIETAAQLRINRDPRSNLPVYSSAPWNTDLFARFVEALKKEQSKRNTLLDGTKKARHLIHSGEVMSGFSILATTIQKSQNEMEKRLYTGRTMTDSSSSSSSSSQVVMHPKPEDVMDINTYPNTCQWAREPQIFPNPNVRTIKDCYDDWHHGCGSGPPIKLLEQKYEFNWRKQMSKIAKVVSIYKNIADACDKTSVKEVQ